MTQKNSFPRPVSVIAQSRSYFLLACIILSLVFLWKIIQPFITIIAVAAILTTAAWPVYSWIVKLLRGRKKIAAILMCLGMVVLIVLPFFFFITILTDEAVETYLFIQSRISDGTLFSFITWESGHLFYDSVQRVNQFININNIDIFTPIAEAAQGLSSFLVSQSTVILKSITGLLFNFLMLIFSMYFFFKDGPEIVHAIGEFSPLPPEYENSIFKKFKQVSLAMLYGIFLTAIVQGIVGGIGLAIAGVQNPVFWGTVMAFFAMLPIGGTAIVWLPAAIILLLTQHTVAGIFLLLWGALLVSVLDNIIKPMVIHGHAHTYPLSTFFVVLGGLMTYGLKGAILGPIVLAISMTLLHIYKLEYAKDTEKEA